MLSEVCVGQEALKLYESYNRCISRLSNILNDIQRIDMVLQMSVPNGRN